MIVEGTGGGSFFYIRGSSEFIAALFYVILHDMAKGFSAFVSGVYYGKYEKWVHAFISFILTLVGSVIFPPLWVAIAVACIGIAKEIADALKPNDHFDLADLAANVGGIVVALLVLLMMAFVQVWRSPFLSD